MTKLFGVFLILLAIAILAIGIWYGWVVCLLGGIITVIAQAKAVAVDPVILGWAIFKILFANLPVVLSAYLATFIGMIGTTCLFDKRRRYLKIGK